MSHTSDAFFPPMSLDLAGDIPLYQQISGWFQRAILAGTLRPGQRVPSTRDLAGALNVSRISVLSAYELLIAEGYFKPLIGVGTCVANAIPGSCSQTRSGGGCVALAAKVPARATRKISRRAALMRGPAQAWLEETVAGRSGIGIPDDFPVGIWSRLVTRHARRFSSETMGYGDPMGLAPFRKALAQYLGASRGVRCDETQVLVTTGSQQALQICALAILDPGDRAWVEEPGYPGAHQAFMAAGGQPVPVPVDSEGLDVGWGQHRDSRVRVAYVTPCHQFPLGIQMSDARRQALLGWAQHRGAWIIEDDYGSECSANGYRVASLQNMDTDNRVIYIGTLSTVMFPALRLGYIVVPRDLAEAFIAVRNAGDIFPSPLYQLAMTDFMREGHLSRLIKRMRAAHANCRRALIAQLRGELPQALELLEGDTATRLVGLLPLGVPDSEVAHRIAAAGLRVKPLSQCYLHPPARGGLILDYTNLTPDAAHGAVLAIDSVIRRYARLPPIAPECARPDPRDALHSSP